MDLCVQNVRIISHMGYDTFFSRCLEPVTSGITGPFALWAARYLPNCITLTLGIPFYNTITRREPDEASPLLVRCKLLPSPHQRLPLSP
ncbi:hypothetical protein E2C01_047471 [Portunus trituberculatus]|uniref:Uncharacterized protein n=1 Tax=Portunus trituberculatus TaxID=210409 RepID=A0A5B7G7Z7_PORTR|nr:hypothetical protein [Portunus trituberculatus]